jgi:hypothetical protein
LVEDKANALGAVDGVEIFFPTDFAARGLAALFKNGAVKRGRRKRGRLWGGFRFQGLFPLHRFRARRLGL